MRPLSCIACNVAGQLRTPRLLTCIVCHVVGHNLLHQVHEVLHWLARLNALLRRHACVCLWVRVCVCACVCVIWGQGTVQWWPMLGLGWLWLEGAKPPAPRAADAQPAGGCCSIHVLHCLRLLCHGAAGPARGCH